jgi:predicted dehydrogenase
MQKATNSRDNTGRVRLASIGVGMIGQVHAKVAARMEECEYVATCDADPSKAGWQHPLTTEQLEISSGDPYPSQLSHFCKVIRGQEEPRTSGEDAQKTLIATRAILESGQTCRPVDIVY